MTFRLMKAFEIEANYQKHKQRLTSINSFNMKKKVVSSTYKNVQLINNYKKHKLTAQIFNQKQKNQILSQNNVQIQKSLTKVYNRQVRPAGNSYHNLSMQRINSRSSIKSVNSQDSRIKEANRKMINKIQKTKSHYSGFRDTSYSKKDKKQNYREQLIKLLENQLGSKPKVVFPNVKNRKLANEAKDIKSEASLTKKHSKNSSLSRLNKTKNDLRAK